MIILEYDKWSCHFCSNYNVLWGSVSQDYWRFRCTDCHPHHGPGGLQYKWHIHTGKTQIPPLTSYVNVWPLASCLAKIHNTDDRRILPLCRCSLSRNWAFLTVSLWRVPTNVAGSSVLWVQTVNSPSGWCLPAVCQLCWFSSSSSWRLRSPRESHHIEI